MIKNSVSSPKIYNEVKALDFITLSKNPTSVKQLTQKLYESVKAHYKEDICEAAPWAKRVLTNYEGTGHAFYLHGDMDGLVTCSFSKVAWPSDFTGSPMEEGSEAMVVAVCEYLAWAGVDSWNNLNA